MLAQDVQKVLQRDFQARGQATMDRVVQDGLQRVCTDTNDRPPAELARQLEADQMKTIAFPAGSLIGDWKSGERIAQSGRGLQLERQAGATGGGSCYNCHQLSPQEMLARHARPEPAEVRLDARQRPRDAALRLRQDLQRQGVQPVLAACRASAIRARSPPSRSRTSSACCSTPRRRSTSSHCSGANFFSSSRSPPRRGQGSVPRLSEAQAAAELYDVPPFGNVSLLHITDTHAQLLPVYFREPSVNLNHAVGEHALKKYGLQRGSALAHACTHLDFEALARRYGKVGGFAHLATLVKRLRASRPHALLLDGGDSWQGSATALWTRGEDMRGAQRRLGVDYMTAHWEFTYGQQPIQASPVKMLAQNVRTADFEDPVFDAYALRPINGVPVAIIGQAFPYTPIANPRHFVPDWTFGIQEARAAKARR